MLRPSALLPILALAAAILAVSSERGEALAHRRSTLPADHHRTRHHAASGAQATYPLTAGSSRIRINGVGEVIGPNEETPRPARRRRNGPA